jgi:hypothetical protein
MRSQLFREDIEAESWWLSFEGPSPLRQKLESQARARARQQAENEARLAARQAEYDAREAERRARGAEQRASAPRATKPAAKRFELTQQQKALMPLVLTFATAPFIALAIYWNDGSAKAGSTSSPPPPPPPAAPAPRVTAQPSASLPPRDQFGVLRECSCAAKGPDGKPLPVRLALRPELGGTMSIGGVTKAYVNLGYFLDVGDQHFRLAPGPHDAPPAAIEGLQLDLVLGCGDEVVVVLGPGAATGWSAQSGQKLWTTRVPSAVAPTLGTGDLSVDCANAVVKGGVFTAPIRPGTSVPLRLQIADGKLL